VEIAGVTGATAVVAAIVAGEAEDTAGNASKRFPEETAEARFEWNATSDRLAK